jgi:methionyl-tRNA formyltransferase
MIRVYTKSRHISKISNFLTMKNLTHEIFTIHENPPDTHFNLGVSYCYPRKISKELLDMPKIGFVNYHPGPLPKYKGPTEYEDAIKNKEIHWGVTVHQMNEEYDSGKIIQILNFDLHEPPTSRDELGALSHYFLFKLFKETIEDINMNKMR